MSGVLTAIVGVIFVTVVLPDLVKHRSQWYAAVGCVVAAILLQTLDLMFTGGAEAGVSTLARVFAVLLGVLVLAAFALLLLCTGGVTSRGMAGSFDGIRVTRRDGTKEVILPGSGDLKDTDAQRAPAHDLDPDELQGVSLRRKPAPAPKDDGPLPLD